MLKFTRVLLLAFILVFAVSCSGSPTATTVPTSTPEATVEATAEATSESTEVVVGPVDPTPSPVRPLITPGAGDQGDNTLNGTPIGEMPTFDPPPTLDELVAQYPDLQAYIDQVGGQLPENMDFAELYTHIVQIYNEHGASGVAVFLEESGILEQLGIPMSYMDLLTAYDEGGLPAVEEMARSRNIINANDELSAYLALDSQANLAAATTDLQALGVTVYDYVPNTVEVEIGIPLEILSQYQTPGSLLDYLVNIAHVEHIVGFRVPIPVVSDNFSLQQFDSTGGEYVGAEAWFAAGFTGSGIRVGILDLGFGGIEDELGQNLPENVTANFDLDRLDRQAEDHGTACAMVVHRIAPDAELFIAYYDGSYSGFQNALEFLADNNVQIINHSVGSPVGPRDGTWGDAPIVDEFVRDTGVLWVNAAGNSAQGYTAWEFNEGSRDRHDFGNDDFYLPFMAGAPFTTIIMNWDGDWEGGEESNYTFTVYDEEGDEIDSAAESRRGRRNDFPFQAIALETTPGGIYYLSVERARGDDDNVFEIFVTNGFFPDWAQMAERSLLVPGDAFSSFTVGATGLTNDSLEDYSSQGPTMDDRIKPDITAPTGEIVPGYRDGFFGTSGAAPLVAGAAALVLQAFPDMTAPEIRAYLIENAVDLGDEGEDPAFGAGRLHLPNPSGEEDEPTPASNDGEPFADVTEYDVQYGVKTDGELGMTITLSFDLNNFEGREVWAAALFLDTDGEALDVVDDDYQIGDTVGTGTRVRVRSGRTSFSDVSLFIPYEALGDFDEDTQLIYIVGIIDWSDPDNVVVLWESDQNLISFR
jgi:subtilisin family serine protease